MKAARTRLRIIAVKYGDSTLAQQGNWWRSVIMGHPEYCRCQPFKDWLNDHFEQLKLAMSERK